MNSYPIELLVQHAPLMFVAGLEVPVSKQDPFHSLVVRLREILSARPKGLVWDKNRGSAFNILLVDKNIRFPPRKVVPTNEQGQSTPHSPLSPLVPSSPLYPDGLIAPVWVRKHVELVPSIFVLFLRLWESPPPLSPLEGREQEMEEERFHDQELATELSARKRALAERGIKLTAVLLASRKLLDDPGLDARLTFLRRQSALDARAALFVLSPVNNTELQDFVHSLTEALREPSIEYYTAHSKRVRRKRNRHASSAYSGYPTSALATTRAVPLRPIGWTVRYEYKMGTFAEFRFEEEVARKHYEDCWNALSEMFNSVTMLPPRTKRWAEAKVLADSVAIKIYKLYLYNNEHALALSYFNRHVKRFCDLSKSWGIGEDTFEYWSWAARQYRILAEIVEIAFRAGLRLPPLLPQLAEERTPQQLALESPPMPGLAPANALQHPGYYYFQAARYTQERYKRFKAIEDAEIMQPTSMSQSPAFNNEKKAEHWEVILELYSKAYEQFKRHSAGQSRLTFYVAVQIATAYHASGKHDLAFKFCERIVKVYHKERWQVMLRPILDMWYESSKQVGNIETCIKLLLERMASGSPEENAVFVEDLLEILRTTKPAQESSQLVVELSSSEQILSTIVIFYEEYTSVGGKTPFQLRITTPPSASLHLLPIASLKIHFSDERQPVTVNRVAGSEDSPSISLGDIGNPESEVTQRNGNLKFIPGTTQVLYGTVSSATAIELKVTKLTLSLLETDWNIDVNFDPSTGDLEPLWRHSPESDWKDVLIHRPNSSSVVFRPSSHKFKVDISHAGNAFVGEGYPVIISVNNHDIRSLSLTMDVLLQPAEDETVNYISIDDERSTSLVRAVGFGTVEPGGSVNRTVTLASGGPGKRVLDFSIQSRVTGAPPAAGEENETLMTVSVDTLEPFRQDTSITYSQPRESLPIFPEVTSFDNWDHYTAEAMVALTLDCVADCELEITGINFIDIDSTHSKLLNSSLHSEQMESLNWLPGDSFAVDACIGVGLHAAEPVPPQVDSYPSPVQVELTWRRANSTEPNATLTRTILSLPELKPPTFGLTILIDPPATAKLHMPFTLDVKVRNNDPHRSADLNFVLEPAEGFVTAGFRTGVLPLLLPGTEEFLSFNLVPISVGNVKLPIFKIQQTLKEESTAPRSEFETNARASAVVDNVPVVDKRWDSVDTSGNNVHFYTSDGEALAELDLSLWLSVLVLARFLLTHPPLPPTTLAHFVMSVATPKYAYEVIPGWFVQDQTDAPTIELPAAFGILDTSEKGWQRVKDFIAQVNGNNRVPGTIYKLLFLGRHGQGPHNVGENKYGTLQWDLHWSKLDGDGELTWGPDPVLTPLGIEQALAANKMWRDQLPKGIPTPDVMYISPFRRAIITAEVTFRGWFHADETEPGMDIARSVVRIAIEDIHEETGEHTCDYRSSKTVLHQEYPWLYFEDGFAEEDPLWTPDHRESHAEQDIRSRKALDKFMAADGTYISVTSHSGTMNSIFRVIGHRPYKVGPGGVVPVLIKATQRPCSTT